MRAIALICAGVLLLGACDAEPTIPLRPEGAAFATLPTGAGITVLPAPAGDAGSTLWSINDSGQAVGEAGSNAFFWDNGTTVEINTGTGGGSVAWSINDAGFTVGTAENTAFVWHIDTGITLLGPGSAESLNEAASPLLVGGDDVGPAVWRHDGDVWTKTRLPVPAGTDAGWVFGVNDAEWMVGSTFTNDLLVGLLWRPTAAGWEYEIMALPAGARYLIPNDINDAGVASGWITWEAGGSTAFTFADGVMTELPFLPGGTNSSAYMINGRGDIAGTSDAADGVSRAVLWSDGVPIALPLPEGAVFCQGVDANNVGQVAGRCAIESQVRSVIWDLGSSVIDATFSSVDAFEASGEISSAGVANAARSKLASAQAAAVAGNLDAARNNLAAFGHQIRAQSGKKVTREAASTLTTMAETAADYLQ